MLELKNIAEVFSGVAVHECGDGPSRFMRLANVSEMKAGKRPELARGNSPTVARALAIEDGDLIIGARGPVTDVCMAGPDLYGAYVSLDLYLVRPNRTLVDPHYLAAFLELPSTQGLLSGGKQGTGLARLAKEALEKTKVPIPPMPQQRLIAGLAQSFEQETRLLTQLTDLNTIFGREAVTRAIRAADTERNFTRSAQ